MPVYVLKAYEPSRDLRHPDVTRRDSEPDPLDRVKVSLHATVEAAQEAGQKSYDHAYDNPPPSGDDEDDDHFVLDWGITGLDAVEDMCEAEYEIQVFEGFDLKPTDFHPGRLPVHVDVTLEGTR